MHHPVLLQESIEGLNVKPNGLYVDATVGEGGHMIEISKRGGKVLGIDLDASQIKNLTPIKSGKNFIFVQGNFADIERIAKDNDFYPVDGILFDLGLSMGQIEKSGRGFSYKRLDEPLDMRVDTTLATTAKSNLATASKVVNSLDQKNLYEILARYGEEINSLAISQAIVRARTIRPIIKVRDLVSVIDKVLGKKDNKTYARVFQALRIAVNDELENLKKGLKGAVKILKKEGRIVVTSFHSLEDRIVKQFIRQNKLKQLNKKVITSKRGFEFERSAKLRIFIKL